MSVRPLAFLRQIGFGPSGTFWLDNDGQIIIRGAKLPKKPGVYVFIERRGIRYIGQTADSARRPDRRTHR